jgi:hypothetical protein
LSNYPVVKYEEKRKYKNEFFHGRKFNLKKNKKLVRFINKLLKFVLKVKNLKALEQDF